MTTVSNSITKAEDLLRELANTTAKLAEVRSLAKELPADDRFRDRVAGANLRDHDQVRELALLGAQIDLCPIQIDALSGHVNCLVRQACALSDKIVEEMKELRLLVIGHDRALLAESLVHTTGSLESAMVASRLSIPDAYTPKEVPGPRRLAEVVDEFKRVLDVANRLTEPVPA